MRTPEYATPAPAATPRAVPKATIYEYEDVCEGDYRAAKLLHRIAYWQPRARIRWGDGRSWIAKLQEEWCSEARLTDHQYKEARRALSRLGLIEAERHLFGNRTLAHVRLTDRALDLMGKAVEARRQEPGPAADRPTGSSEDRPTGSAADHRTTTQGDTAMSYDREKGAGRRRHVTVASVVQAQEADPLPLLLEAKPSAAAARRVWQVAYSRAFPDEPGGGWQSRHERNVRLALDEFGPDALRMVAAVVQNWASFCNKVEQRTGRSLPTRPQSYYLYSYRDSVIVWYADREKPSKERAGIVHRIKQL